jgi:GNAT superfamily N-acetyltransferase
METAATLCSLEQISSMREDYRREMNCQIIHDSIHSREGWSLEYLLRLGRDVAGYGSVAVLGPWKAEPSVYEFYVLREFRARTFDLFDALLDAIDARRIETQSNDPFLTVMLHTFCDAARAESVLFNDQMRTGLAPAGATFRRARASDGLDISEKQLSAHGVVEVDGKIAAKGGILFHYNPPYGDIYMEVGEAFRRRGLGSYLVQELKRVCYERGNIPAARCNVSNISSRKTLQKAGFVPCGNIIVGMIKPAG